MSILHGTHYGDRDTCMMEMDGRHDFSTMQDIDANIDANTMITS